MSLFSFFSTSKKSQNLEVKCIGDTRIAYHDSLLSDLHHDHQELLKLFDELSKLTKRRDENRVKKSLGRFSILLREHVLEENVKLYVYLHHALKNDVEKHKIIGKYKSEMHVITKQVNHFVLMYTTLDEWNEVAWGSFIDELNDLGAALVKRIKNEESVLYPLYVSPETYPIQ